VFVYCVDNVLVKVADPVFLGFCIQKEAEVGNKVVERRHGESVGVTGLLGGHTPTVLEYTESTASTAEVTDANICIHYFSFDFLTQVLDRETELPLHTANKKIPHLDLKTGEMITPCVPNGIKLEKFVFDSFRFCSSSRKFVVFQVLRDEEFAPLKNSSGEGSPAVCREAVNRLHRKWLLKAGARIKGDEHCEGKEKHEEKEREKEEEEECCVEVSPLVSYCGEGLEPLVSGKNPSMSATSNT